MTLISRFDFEAAIRAAIPATPDCHIQHRDTQYVVHNRRTAERFAKLGRRIVTTPNESWDCDEASEELDVKIRKKERRHSPKPPACGYIFYTYPNAGGKGHSVVVVLVDDDDGERRLYYIQPGDTRLGKPADAGITQMYFAII